MHGVVRGEKGIGPGIQFPSSLYLRTLSLRIVISRGIQPICKFLRKNVPGLAERKLGAFVL